MSSSGITGRRNSVLAALRGILDQSDVTAAARAVERLRADLSTTAPLRSTEAPRALLAYGGGKDSSYMVAFVRLMQLIMQEQYGETLQLRVITNRHVGMPTAVMANIDRTYRALELYDDPDVMLLLADAATIRPFAVDLSLPQELIERNRLDVLMTGHRCYGDGRPTFCNACNLSMVSAFAVAARFDGGVDVVITGDSPWEQRAYLGWVRRVARKLDTPARSMHRFSGFINTMQDIADRYFADIHAGLEPGASAVLDRARGEDPIYFSIYEDTPYRSGAHWPLLTKMLRFRFDELAFSFTESDCANPALMAHLRGLRAEHVFGTGYERGVTEYARFAIDLMRAKDFPPQLISRMSDRYATLAAIATMRRRVTRYAQNAFGLSDSQLICMVFSPFASRGLHLHRYLSSVQPDLVSASDTIHDMLADTTAITAMTAGQQRLATRLLKLSGLDLQRLRATYNAVLAAPEPGGTATHNTPIGIILAGDPHKAKVTTRHEPGGPLVLEQISGR